MKPRQFIYLSSDHSDDKHRQGVKLADMVRTSQPRTLIYRSENPSCKILKYVNVAHSINNIGPAEARANGWICLNDAGEEVHHIKTATEYALDLHIPACREAVAQHCKTQVNDGYDGIFGDYLGKPYAYNKNHYDSQLNHADGSPYTDAEMASDMSSLIDRLRELGCGILAGNGVPQAGGTYGYYTGQYKALSDPLIVKLDYVMIEGALGWDESDAASRSVSDWLKTVQMWKGFNIKVIYYCKPIGNNPERACFALGSYMFAQPRETDLIHYSSVSSYQISEYWQRLMSRDYGEYVTESHTGNIYEVEYSKAVFEVDASTKMGEITFKEVNGKTVKLVNETSAPVTYYKRVIIVADESLATIPPGGSAEVEVDDGDTIVQK